MTQQIDKEIYALVLRMLAIAPATFENTKKSDQINAKIKETIMQLESAVSSLKCVKHGTSGGRTKFSKDLGVTLLMLFEFLPLVESYKQLNTFTDTIKRRLSLKGNIVQDSYEVKFGQVHFADTKIYAAEVKYNSNTFVVYLCDDKYIISDKEHVLKRFEEKTISKNHTRINNRFDKINHAIKYGYLTVDHLNYVLRF